MTPPARSRHPAALALALLFIVSLLAYTWASHFPYFYHSDEESKALQLLYGYRNYWHPLLMLNATQSIATLCHVERDVQSLTMVGRTLSAIFSSLGIVCFTEFARRRRGIFTALLTAFLLLTLPLLFEVSRYCKEDPALFMGLAITLLALDFFLTIPNLPRLLVLGAAAGIATSAKYPGALLILGLLPAIYLRLRRVRPLLFFLLAATGTILLLNWQWVAHFPEMISGIQRESGLLVAGHDGVAGHYPHAEYLRILTYQQGWPLLLAALFGMAGMAFPRRKGAVFSTEFVLGLAALLVVLAMSWSAKISERYLLPVMAVASYLAACGTVSAGQWIAEKYRRLFHGVLIAAIAAHPLLLFGKTVRDFRSDSRGEMARWIAGHLARGERVATSLWTRLPGIYPGQYLSGLAAPDYVADLGSLDDLRKMGYRWVAVADVETERFEDPLQGGNSSAQTAFLRRRTFYHDLREQADLRWSKPVGVVYNLHPGLKLYQLRPWRP